MITTALDAPDVGTERDALVRSLVFMGMALAVISSLGAPLVPQIAGAYHVPLSQAQWSLTITLLAGTVATPVLGRLGDGPHRRTATLVAVAASAVGCALAALPLDFGLLLAGRALQGAGIGVIPLAITTARDSLSRERGQRTVAMLSITTAAGVGLGYPLTGLIAQGVGLRAAFWFGTVISAVSFVIGLRVLPRTGHLPRRPLDVPGACLLSSGLAGLMLVLSEGGTWGWASTELLGLLALSVVLLAAWTVHELRCAHPLIDLRVARHRSVVVANLVIAVMGVAMYLLMSLVTRLAQTPVHTGYGFGASVAVTGLALLPFSVTSVVASRAQRRLSRHLSPRAVLALSCLVCLGALVFFTLAHSALWQLFVAMGMAGLGIGCAFAVIPQLIVLAVPATETGSAMSFNQVLRCVGYTIGSALSATVLQSHTAAGQLLPTAGGYSAAGLVGVLSAAAAVLLALVLSPRHRPAAAAETV
ncbi:MFS transporter [Streptomyces sp. NPDC090442]|uniref:MFS transporter n=1 Tax=Streptomyces sp. NPDC090442 TaxID=3365962 RepID=UPI0038029F21